MLFTKSFAHVYEYICVYSLFIFFMCVCLFMCYSNHLFIYPMAFPDDDFSDQFLASFIDFLKLQVHAQSPDDSKSSCSFAVGRLWREEYDSQGKKYSKKMAPVEQDSDTPGEASQCSHCNWKYHPLLGLSNRTPWDGLRLATMWPTVIIVNIQRAIGISSSCQIFPSACFSKLKASPMEFHPILRGFRWKYGIYMHIPPKSIGDPSASPWFFRLDGPSMAQGASTTATPTWKLAVLHPTVAGLL